MMLLYRLALYLFALAISLSPVAAQHGDLDALAWLGGCWEGQGGGGENQECWMVPEGGMMLGVSRVISESGTAFEFLRIAPHGDGLALLASPGGKPAVAFQLVESAEGLAIFTNPEHDFPQRIIYRRDGHVLTARVEAQREGEWRGFNVTWRRLPGGWRGSLRSIDADLRRQVREVETAFAKTMADRDHEAFVGFLSEEAIFHSSSTARGRDQVAAKWKRYFEEPQAPFSWQPETVEVLDSGALALSTGPVHAADGRLISTFTSIWRHEAPGEWRIVFDKGEQVCGDADPQ